MTKREFFEKIADLFGRKNWIDFSTEERIKLSDVYDDIRIDGYNIGYDDGYNDGGN